MLNAAGVNACVKSCYSNEFPPSCSACGIDGSRFCDYNPSFNVTWYEGRADQSCQDKCSSIFIEDSHDAELQKSLTCYDINSRLGSAIWNIWPTTAKAVEHAFLEATGVEGCPYLDDLCEPDVPEAFCPSFWPSLVL